jgi:hypothetical protein
LPCAQEPTNKIEITFYIHVISFSFCYRWVYLLLLVVCKDPVAVTSVWTVTALSRPQELQCNWNVLQTVLL